MKPAIIVDIDGCVCKTDFILEEAKQLALKDDNYWDYFNKNVSRYKQNPWCVDLVRKYAKTHDIIFLTARSQETSRDTINMINVLFPTASFSLFMREKDDKRKACEVKDELLGTVLARNLYCIDFAIDDETENCNMFKKYGIPTLQVK